MFLDMYLKIQDVNERPLEPNNDKNSNNYNDKQKGVKNKKISR